MATLGERELDALFGAVKSTLAEMTAVGGRDTEKDLFGNSGGYKVILSKIHIRIRALYAEVHLSRRPIWAGRFTIARIASP